MSARGSGRQVWVMVLALVIAACGGGDGGGEDGGQASAAPTAAPSMGADVTTEAATGGTAGAGGGQTYVVESGDTLSAIAARFDTTVRAIVRANDLTDPDVIDVGQELTIP